MKKITVGIIAHVDSGKTTLSEALLYMTGSIRSFGRVDKGASFLDSDRLERKRGITIFSKQARFNFGNTSFVLIDTPGHADFSAETERTLQILDCCILIISVKDGIKGQTKVLWNLLKEYKVPVYIFVNKMDLSAEPGSGNSTVKVSGNAEQEGTIPGAGSLNMSWSGNAERKGTPDPSAEKKNNPEKETISQAIKELTDDAACEFPISEENAERAAMCSEEAMEEFLETGGLAAETVKSMILKRQLFPCFYGSALKMEGVDKLLKALDEFTAEPEFDDEFSARAFKIAHDKDGSRLTFVKITGGSLKTKTLLADGDERSKVNQIRFYSGEKFTTAEAAYAGDVCALTGLSKSFSGQGFGKAEKSMLPVLTPVLSFRVVPEDGRDPVTVLPFFRILSEESPELDVTWDEDTKDIYANVMGHIQLEIITSIMKDRFGADVSFDSGRIVYRETISKPVIGVGHFEPLRHYAEVHLLMEPAERGSGLVFESTVTTDHLAKNWQRLIMFWLSEIKHRGVLTGFPITDMKITLVAGKAHLKHTEGGDFRQAVCRAVRQGLMMTENVLLEPFYRFRLEVPSRNLGRALNDLDRMNAEFQSPEIDHESDLAVITGRGPVSSLKDYAFEVAAYSKGFGSISFTADGYDNCLNAEEVISEIAYDPLRDVKNPPDSVFCYHGSGSIVPFDEVYDHMHLPLDGSKEDDDVRLLKEGRRVSGRRTHDVSIGMDEVNSIIASISGANSRKSDAGKWRKKALPEAGPVKIKPAPQVLFPVEQADILLVDAYNVIFAWEDLRELAEENIDAARDALVEALEKYAAMTESEVIAVFDAYKTRGSERREMNLNGVRIVFTKENETADLYIERFTNLYSKKKKLAVVTSDRTEQIVTGAQGSRLISSREFKTKLETMTDEFNRKHNVAEE